MMTKSALSEEDFLTAGKEAALRYISYRPRSVHEVAKKLSQAGFPEQIVNAVIKILLDRGYLNDEEFAEMWLRSRTSDKPSGKIRVYHELLNKGVDKNIIERVLQKLSPETEEKMALLLVKKKTDRGVSNYKKLEGYLLRRGFQPELVRKLLRDSISVN